MKNQLITKQMASRLGKRARVLAARLEKSGKPMDLVRANLALHEYSVLLGKATEVLEVLSIELSAALKYGTTNRKEQPPVDALYEAVSKWVEANGGKLVVIGGIEIMKWPLDRKGQFRVSIGCLGKMPIKPKAKK